MLQFDGSRQGAAGWDFHNGARNSNAPSESRKRPLGQGFGPLPQPIGDGGPGSSVRRTRFGLFMLTMAEVWQSLWENRNAIPAHEAVVGDDRLEPMSLNVLNH